MKIVKLIGCVMLLCALVIGCVMLAEESRVYAMEEEGEADQTAGEDCLLLCLVGGL